MNKSKNVSIAILGIIIGWSLNALAWSEYLHAPFHSIALVLGVGLIILSVAYLFIDNKKPNNINFDHPKSIRQWLTDFNWKLISTNEKDLQDLDQILSYEDFWKWSTGKVEHLQKI